MNDTTINLTYLKPFDLDNEIIHKEPANTIKADIRFISYVIILSISLLGIICNCINFVIFTRLHVKAITYVYLRALSVSDFLTMFLCFIRAPKYVGLEYLNGIYAVELIERSIIIPFANWFIACSNLTTVAVTIERYLAICHPLRAQVIGLQNKKGTHIVLFIIWTFSFVLYFPVVFQFHIMKKENSKKYIPVINEALTKNTSYDYYTVIREAIARIAPIMIIALLNCKTVIGFRKIMKRRKSRLNKTDSLHLNQQRRLIIVLVGVALMYFFLATPAAVLLIIPPYVDTYSLAFRLANETANILEISNYAISCFIYYIFCRDYRDILQGCFSANKVEPIVVSVPDVPTKQENFLVENNVESF